MTIQNRTTAAEQRRAPAHMAERHQAAPRPPRQRRLRRLTMRQRLRLAARLHIDVKLRNGLQAKLDIGPAWIGLAISTLGAIWWPGILPLIQPLLKLL